jgi:leader peptidase (prepilin peptidase) / N-methyltransferase
MEIVNLIFDIELPLETILLALFVLGASIGSAVNLAIYRLAWFPRRISPWSQPEASAPPRRFLDRVPVLGWLGLRREAALHGRGFWIRPMLLELCTGLGLAWLYWWEIANGGLLPLRFEFPLQPAQIACLHRQLFAHVVLIALMLAASMIDIDEKIIPDAITVPGTLAGLLMAIFVPQSLLPDPKSMQGLDFLFLTSPNKWPLWLDGYPRWESLCIAGACWLLWCAALLPRPWRTRHGLLRALQLCWARVRRERISYRIAGMAALGLLIIALVWLPSGPTWMGLLSSLVGMAAAGGMIWLVRIIGAVTLRREAMGFGDVTLMAMIGAFLGWQPCLIIFFLAPIAGLVLGIVRLILFRDKEIPYGPFLCMATVFVIVCWDAVWDKTQSFFGLGETVPIMMLACLAIMGLMLWLWRLILSAFQR